MATITTTRDLQYTIENLSAVRVTPTLSKFEFNRSVSMKMK